MSINVLVSGAAGEAAALVAFLQGSADGRWDGAGFAADIEGFAILGFLPGHDGAVAGQSSGRFR